MTVPTGVKSWEQLPEAVTSSWVTLHQGSDFGAWHKEFDSSLGRGFPVTPHRSSPFPPSLFLFLRFSSPLRGNLWGFKQPGEESRGGNSVCLNVGQLSLAELQLYNPEMETALVTSGNDTPHTLPVPGLSRVLLGWDSRVTLFPLPCDLGGAGISCSLVIGERTGCRHPVFHLLALQKATSDLQVQLLPSLLLSRGYGLRGRSKNPTIQSACASPNPAERKAFSSDTHDRRPSRSLQSDSPQMGAGNLLAHLLSLWGTGLWQPGWMYTSHLLSWGPCGFVYPFKQCLA